MDRKLGEQYPEVYKRYVFPNEGFWSPLQAVAALTNPPLKAVADAFANSLEAATAVSTLPFRMASSSVHQRRLQAFATAQRIRALDADFSTEQERDEWAWRTAREALDRERVTEDGVLNAAREIVAYMNSLLTVADVLNSAEELLRQCTVLSWSAFEVLASDVFVVLLNAAPSKSSLLFDDARTKTYFKQKELGAVLDEHQYNLSSCMGDVLVQQHRVDDVATIRNLFDVLFPNDDGLRTALADNCLWQLAQDRNLIVHRRAVVDRQYREKTGSTAEVGSVLALTPEAFEGYLRCVRDAGATLLRAAAAG